MKKPLDPIAITTHSLMLVLRDEWLIHMRDTNIAYRTFRLLGSVINYLETDIPYGGTAYALEAKLRMLKG